MLGPRHPQHPSICAGGFAGAPAALRIVPKSRSRVSHLAVRRSLSLVRSATHVPAVRLSSLALRQAGLEVAVGSLSAYRAHLPRPCSLQLMLLLHPFPHHPTLPLPWRLLRPLRPLRRSDRTRGFWGGGASVSPHPGGGLDFRVPGGGAGGDLHLALDLNDFNPPLPLPPDMHTHGKPCHVHPLKRPLLPARDDIQPQDSVVVAVPSFLVPVCTRQCPLTYR